jgi:hypothetical protein
MKLPFSITGSINNITFDGTKGSAGIEILLNVYDGLW